MLGSVAPRVVTIKVGHAESTLSATEGALVDADDLLRVPRRIGVGATAAKHATLLGWVRQPLPINSTAIIIPCQADAFRNVGRMVR